jgi:hypothetical protein
MSVKDDVDSNSWCEREFSSVDLGDLRLNSRLVKTSKRLLNLPEASLNQACHGWSETKAAYRLFSNDKLTSKRIMDSHEIETLTRIQGTEGVVLSIQDTTYFKFDALVDNRRYEQKKKFEGMHGIVMHHTLAVSSSGIPLGVITQKMYDRNIGSYRKDRREHQKLPIEEKESFRWIESLRQCHELSKDYKIKKFVTVCDRECDIYEFLHEARKLDENYVVRSAKNRCLEDGKSNYTRSGAKVWDEIRKTKVKAKIEIEVPRKPGVKARTAKLSVRFGEVELKPPKRVPSAKSEALTPVRVNCIILKEPRPPKDTEALEWILLTNLKIKDTDDALEKVEWYKKRWTIESFHKVMKSGFNVEKSQLQSVDRLKKFISLVSVLAVYVHWMTYFSRENPEDSCEILLQEHEWKALDCKINRKSEASKKPPDLNTAIVWIAVLGGYLNRKSDPPPGSMVLWRGWRRLSEIADDWLIFKSKTYG